MHLDEKTKSNICIFGKKTNRDHRGRTRKPRCRCHWQTKRTYYLDLHIIVTKDRVENIVPPKNIRQ